MQAEQVPILGEHNVFFEFIPPDRTEIAEICGGPNPIHSFVVVGGFRGFVSATLPALVQLPGPSVEPIDDRTREQNGDDKTDEHFDSEENEAEEERKIFPGRESANQGDVRHCSVSGDVEVRSEKRNEGRAQRQSP